LLAIEQVDAVVEVRPSTCMGCGQPLVGEDPTPARHQVAEVPRVRAVVTEYRRHTLCCLACGTSTTAAWPEGMPCGSFGPRAQATVGYLTGRLNVSQRDVGEVLAVLFGLEVSLGSVSALAQQVSAAVAAPVAEAHAYVQTQPTVNADETSWPQGRQGGWLWVAVSALVSVFLVRKSRASAVAKELLGARYAGIVGSDRYGGYTWVDVQHRQICWAHLRRDFTAFVERGGESARIGQALLDASDAVFALWYRVRDGTLDRAAFQAAVLPLRAQVGTLLREGQALTHAKTGGTCDHLVVLEPALWTFVTSEGVEPTNNAAERALRRAVLWRRRSFGTKSDAGSRAVERLLTVVTTLRQQGRDVLDYLTVACQAAMLGEPAPSLLPSAQPVPLALLPAHRLTVPAA
jgi:transposase